MRKRCNVLTKKEVWMDRKAHIPVMLKEVQHYLCQREGVFFDGTFGAGGYSRMILEASERNKVHACDRDENVLPFARDLQSEYGDRFDFAHHRFSEIDEYDMFDGIVLDLGVSSMQIDDATRGFSFQHDGELDMRMGLCEKSALDVIHDLSENALADVIYKYGEERLSRRIAHRIKERISERGISTTRELAEAVHSCFQRRTRIDNATRTFQAIRIYVNNELGELEEFLHKAIHKLKPGARMVIVSFHSLEDRVVKHFFKNCSEPFRMILKKPLCASEEEIQYNARSRSAKMRVLECGQ